MTPNTLITHQHAREIMGSNYFGVEEWQRLCGLKSTSHVMSNIPNITWGADVLAGSCPFYPSWLRQRISDTHFLFLGLDTLDGVGPLTITALEQMHRSPTTEEPVLNSGGPKPWYQKHPFANYESLKLRWYLLLKDPVPDSAGKFREVQSSLLPHEYRVPFAIEEAAKDFLFALKQTAAPWYQRLFPRSFAYVRCRDVISDGSQPLVGLLTSGLVISSVYSGLDSCGIGASRRLHRIT